MRILFISSEAVPFVKTGGLADVAGALPKALHALGHDVRLALPRYGDLDPRYRLLPLMPEMKVSFGETTINGSVLRCSYPGSNMPVYFIDEPTFSQRRGIYGTGKADFPDNDRRFAFFSMAALWLLKGLDWQPDVIHANDWQTGLIPALLRHHPELTADPFYKSIRTVFAVHNMAYQGNVDKFIVPAIGMPWDVFTPDGMEFYGRASYLKSGLAFADAVVTVSPTYAEEIKTEEMGAGMHGTLQNRADRLHGILNGIDMAEWNPETDAALPVRFSAADPAGKAACKEALQKDCGLKLDPKIPVIGMASRLVAQKGFNLIVEALDELLALNAQYVVLGTGDEEFEAAFEKAAAAHPDRIHTRLAYDVPFSHRLIAGSDFFLMPSIFEPCGLTQMYSMRYGTIPIVRKTGGLADSVVPVTAASLTDGTGTGVMFEEPTAEALVVAVKEALALYGRTGDLSKARQNALGCELGWDLAAKRYVELYESLSRPMEEVTH